MRSLKPFLRGKRTREDGADAAESDEEQTLFTQEGEKMRICRLAFITTTGDYVQLLDDCLCRDRCRVWRKNEGINAKEAAIGRKVDGICATQSGHVVKTMTVKTF